MAVMLMAAIFYAQVWMRVIFAKDSLACIGVCRMIHVLVLTDI